MTGTAKIEAGAIRILEGSREQVKDWEILKTVELDSNMTRKTELYILFKEGYREE